MGRLNSKAARKYDNKFRGGWNAFDFENCFDGGNPIKMHVMCYSYFFIYIGKNRTNITRRWLWFCDFSGKKYFYSIKSYALKWFQEIKILPLPQPLCCLLLFLSLLILLWIFSYLLIFFPFFFLHFLISLISLFFRNALVTDIRISSIECRTQRPN